MPNGYTNAMDEYLHSPITVKGVKTTRYNELLATYGTALIDNIDSLVSQTFMAGAASGYAAAKKEGKDK